MRLHHREGSEEKLRLEGEALDRIGVVVAAPIAILVLDADVVGDRHAAVEIQLGLRRSLLAQCREGRDHDVDRSVPVASRERSHSSSRKLEAPEEKSDERQPQPSKLALWMTALSWPGGGDGGSRKRRRARRRNRP
jgi:hypothetical protein